MSRSGIGTIVHIATGVPATFDKAGYEAMTWVKIENIEMVGSFSVTDSIIEVPHLESGFTKGIKGARAGTTVALPYEGDTTDAGQIALRDAARARSGEYSVRVTLPADGGGVSQVEAASGLIYDFLKNDISTSDYDGASATMRTNYVSVPYQLP